MLHNLEKAPGSAHKNRKRVGRGPGSTTGKTAGKGHKGQNARSGSSRRIGFEGGQMPIYRRLPKRGFNNIFKKEYAIVNLGDIANCQKIDLGQPITVTVLAESGLIRNQKLPVKVLGEGTLEAALSIEVQKFSATAEKKIQDAGGKATVIP
jgi:large subunit ribosomal protein L15